MISRKKKDLASAENRTQSRCLEGSDVFHYTTEACLVNLSQNGYFTYCKISDEILNLIGLVILIYNVPTYNIEFFS